MTEQTAVAMRDDEPRQVAAYEAGATTPMAMIDRALASGHGPETLEKLLALQERWEANQGRKAFDAAIAEAKAEIPPIVRNKVGYNNKRYADLSAIAKVVDPILSKHGLSYRFRTAPDNGVQGVTCVLSHRDGYSEENTILAPPDGTGNKNAIQAIGSTLTYLQRYTLVQALGLSATDDDDGRSAGSGETVSDDQVKQLRRALTESKADAAKFCAYFNIDQVEDLPASEYTRALGVIEATRRKREAETQGAPA